MVSFYTKAALYCSFGLLSKKVSLNLPKRRFLYYISHERRCALESVRNLREEISESAERLSDLGRNMQDALQDFNSRLLSLADRVGRRKDMGQAISRGDYGKVMGLLNEIEEELGEVAA
jgi:hypothetical protein